MTSFIGTAGVSTYVAIVLRSGLSLWAKHRIKPNPAWTPTAMMAKARAITGAELSARDYDGAIAALTTWIDENGTTGVREAAWEQKEAKRRDEADQAARAAAHDRNGPNEFGF